jgi:hypothetical protein
MVGFAFSTFIAVYVIAILEANVHSGRFLISDAFSHDPARSVASFGMSMTSTLACLVFVTRYLYGDGSKRERVALYLSITACVCMLGVQAISLAVYRVPHNSFAFGLFSAGITAGWIYVHEESKHTEHLSPDDLLNIKLRYFFIYAAIVALIVMVCGCIWNYAVASAAEITMTVCMFSYLASYQRDFHHKRLTIVLL